MTLRTVLYQTVFKAPFVPALPALPPLGGQYEFDDQVRISIGRNLAAAATVALMQFTAYGGTVFPAPPRPFTAFDEPRAPQFSAAQQQFAAASEFVAPPVPGTTTPGGGVTQPDQIYVRHFVYQSEFNINFAPAAAVTTLIGPFTSTPFDTPQAPQYKAAEQQFTSYTGFTPPATIAAPNTPFDAPRAPLYPAGEQQFTAWHSPFFGTRTPSTFAAFVPFDTPIAPQYAASQQQFSSYPGTFVPAAVTPNYLSTFYVDTAIPRLTVSPALLQFQDLPMGPELTAAAEVTLGRWGPDETKEERKRRHAQGLFFQWEEVPSRSGFAPEPVEHPPHEPQKWADEPAAVRTGAKASPVSGVEHLAAVLADVPHETWDDPEILDLIEQLLKNGTNR